MTSTKFALGVLLLLISIAASSQQTAVRGTFSGTFQSRDSDVRPFTVTGPIRLDARRGLIQEARVTSDCLKNIKEVDLQVTFNGQNATFAGSNADGTVTLLGTINPASTQVDFSQYVINGSPSGGCEVDRGTGTASRVTE